MKRIDMTYFDIPASIESIEFYGIASAMGFDQNATADDMKSVDAAKKELTEALIEFTKQNAQAILLKHMYAEDYIKAETAKDAIKFYVIQQFIDENTDEVLYWNNQIGFVSLGEATTFTEEERNSFTNPDNTCWVQLPKLPR